LKSKTITEELQSKRLD